MKIILTLALFFGFAPQVFSEDCGEPPMPQSFQSMDALLSTLDTNMQNVEIKDCGQDAELLRKSVQLAQRMVQNLEEDIRNVQTDDSNARKNFSDAAGRLRCMDKKIKDAKITCKSLSAGTLGWAIPFIGTGIQIDQEQHRGFQKGIDWTNVSLEANIASTIVHEMSHKCGTNDKHYYDLPTDSLNSDPNWGNTADVFQNWAKWGFCIPGPQCAARQATRNGTPLASIR